MCDSPLLPFPPLPTSFPCEQARMRCPGLGVAEAVVGLILTQQVSSPTPEREKGFGDLRQQVAVAIENRLDPKKQTMVCQKYPQVRGVLATPRPSNP